MQDKTIDAQQTGHMMLHYRDGSVENVEVEKSVKAKDIIIKESQRFRIVIEGLDDVPLECRACLSLQSVCIPEGVVSIEGGVFTSCINLKSVMVPKSLASLNGLVFLNCTSLESISIPNIQSSISPLAFYMCKSLRSMVIPSSLISLGFMSFGECESLQSLLIHDGLTEIDNGAFAGCSSLRSVLIPHSVEKAGFGLFSGCVALHSVRMSDRVSSISSGFFDGCLQLSLVVLSSMCYERTKDLQEEHPRCVFIKSTDMCSLVAYMSGMMKYVSIEYHTETLTWQRSSMIRWGLLKNSEGILKDGVHSDDLYLMYEAFYLKIPGSLSRLIDRSEDMPLAMKTCLSFIVRPEVDFYDDEPILGSLGMRTLSKFLCAVKPGCFLKR